MDPDRTYASFVDHRLIVSGDLPTMLRATKAHIDSHPNCTALIFDNSTGKQIDFDFRGPVEEIVARESGGSANRGPGRPRLGVVAREVTLLPRHWEWLADQPGGASATIRRLVDDARKGTDTRARARQAAATTGRIMTALAGDLPNYEEASRALYAGNKSRFEELIADWPGDVRGHLLGLAAPVFER